MLVLNFENLKTLNFAIYLFNTYVYVIAEDVIPIKTTVIPNGTYVIRKGKERKNVFEIPEFVPSPDQEKNTLFELSQEEILNIEETNELPQPSINMPKYRHSIDLALPSVMRNSNFSPK